MKISFVLSLLLAVSATSCGQKPAATAPPVMASSASLPPEHPAIDAGKTSQGQPPLTQKAQVLSVMKVTQYTYLEVMQDNKIRWLATPAPAAAAAKKNDTIQFDDGTLMSNFNSKLLNRTFPSIALVGRVVISDESVTK